MRVLVIRSGSTWFGAGAPRPGVLQSQDNHTAVARAIVAGGHEVLCCGRIVGDLADWDGRPMQQVSWAVRPQDGIGGNQNELRRVLQEVVAFRPDCLVNITGSEHTTLSPVTAEIRGVETLDGGWRYGWFLVEVLRELRLPRICVITDVRCYPRESEICLHDYERPAAVLSQQDEQWEQKIVDSRWMIRAKYSGIERLRLTGVRQLQPVAQATGCIALANSHMQAARIDKHKRQLWAWIARDQVVDAYGHGWEDPPGRIIGHAPIEHSRIYGLLNQHACGPLVPMLHGWISPKYREYALGGCLPLPYGRGDDLLTYDCSTLTKEHHCVPLQASCRFSEPEELVELVKRSEMDPAWREDQIEMALYRSTPDSGVLLSCVEHFGRGGKTDLERFGGYERIA
jgi:hypothetical protein